MRKIAVLTSGGDSPGMNAAINALVHVGNCCGLEVLGVTKGFQGLISGQAMSLDYEAIANIVFQGGTILKTARSEEFKTAIGFSAALKFIHTSKIDCVIVIGGNGSMCGAMKLSDSGVPTLVIPATIDNDMPGTEYTIGFDTSLNIIFDAINKIRYTMASHERVGIVQVMGRDSGHLALMSGLACGAEAILIPEKPNELDKVCQRLQKSFVNGKRHSIVVMAEGVGRVEAIAKEIAEKAGLPTHVTVLGYLQRGGMPTVADNIMASRMGEKAIDCCLKRELNGLISVHSSEVKFVGYENIKGIKNPVNASVYNLAQVLGM